MDLPPFLPDAQKLLARLWFKKPLNGRPEKYVEKIVSLPHALVPKLRVSIPRVICLCVLVLDQ